MVKQHHFLLLRHCVRSTRHDLKLGLSNSSSNDPTDYMSRDTLYPPAWNVGPMECTAIGNKLAQATGAWMMENDFFGSDTANQTIQWEIIADASHRDVDTAYYLTQGMQEKLQNRSNSLGAIHVDERFSNAEETKTCQWHPDTDRLAQEIQTRLQSHPRPTPSFQDALDIWQELLGVGDAGPLRSAMPTEPELDYDSWRLKGAASFLQHMGATLFYSRASDIDPPFAARATWEQVYQLQQFQSWYHSVMYVGNTQSAVWGAWQTQAMIRVLRQGYYSHPGKDDWYDARVTILLGHDSDLDTFATALNVQWELDSPYISGPRGAFVPTPPMSGLHAVRTLDTDELDLSFVYPVYSQDDKDSSKVKKSGKMRRTPLLFQDDVAQLGKDSTKIFATPTQSSTDVLEAHILKTVSSYAPQASEGYLEAQQYWDSQISQSYQTPTHPLSSTNSSVLWRGSFIVAITSCVVGLIFALVFKKRKSAHSKIPERDLETQCSTSSATSMDSSSFPNPGEPSFSPNQAQVV